MKRGLIFQLNHDVRNIIETMDFQYRMKNTNNEYSQVFHFFDNLCNYTCPNPSGRCVVRWLNVKILWMNGQYHKKDGPAIEYANGHKEWYYEGQRHREDGPTIEFANGDKAWYYNSQTHREDGPAIEYANGDKYWYVKGQLHREDGPAIEWANGDKFWYVKGQRHRNPKKGPAIEYADGSSPNEYWEFGERVK